MLKFYIISSASFFLTSLVILFWPFLCAKIVYKEKITFDKDAAMLSMVGFIGALIISAIPIINVAAIIISIDISSELFRQITSGHARIREMAGRFEKVSFEQYKEAFKTDDVSDEYIQDLYDRIKLPKRATKGSAGYDFFAPTAIELEPNKTITIPTGVRAVMRPGWVLKLYPRSGLGFKYRLQLNNNVGIIDEDYAFSDNEGHVFFRLTNCTNENKTVNIKAGDGFAQGIFVRYGVTDNDDATGKRNGGFGSTTK